MKKLILVFILVFVLVGCKGVLRSNKEQNNNQTNNNSVESNTMESDSNRLTGDEFEKELEDLLNEDESIENDITDESDIDESILE